MPALDRFVGLGVDPARNADAARRVRLCGAIAIVGLVLQPMTFAMRSSAGVRFAWVPAVTVFVACSATLWLLRASRRRAATHVLVGSFAAWAVLLNVLTHGRLPGILFGIGALPLVGVLLGGRRLGLAWGSLGPAAVVWSHYLAGSGAEPVVVVTDDFIRAVWYRAALMVAVAFFVLALLFETMQNRALDELAQMRLRAEAHSRAKSDFLANMSHEIRTPLNGVIGMLHLLTVSKLNGDQRECAETATHSAQSLLSIVNDILDFSKIEAGQMTLDTAPMSPQQVVRDATRVVRPRAEQQGLRVVEALPGETGRMVMGDSVRVGQVLLNLLSNAIKFTRAGDVRVSVQVVAGGGCRGHLVAL